MHACFLINLYIINFVPHQNSSPYDFIFHVQIKCHEIIIEDTDISKALVNYVTTNLIEILVLGTPSKNGLFRYD